MQACRKTPIDTIFETIIIICFGWSLSCLAASTTFFLPQATGVLRVCAVSLVAQRGSRQPASAALLAIAGAVSLGTCILSGKELLSAVVVEELVFRKMVCDRTNRRDQPIAACISALCFGAFHLSSQGIVGAFCAMLYGIAYTNLYMKTADLSEVILWHLIHNTLGLLPLFGSAEAGKAAESLLFLLIVLRCRMRDGHTALFANDISGNEGIRCFQQSCTISLWGR